MLCLSRASAAAKWAASSTDARAPRSATWCVRCSRKWPGLRNCASRWRASCEPLLRARWPRRLWQEFPGARALRVAARTRPRGAARARARFDARRRSAAAPPAVAIDRTPAAGERSAAAKRRARRTGGERDRTGRAEWHRGGRRTVLSVDDRLPGAGLEPFAGHGARQRLVARPHAACARCVAAGHRLRARCACDRRQGASAFAHRRSHRSARRRLYHERVRQGYLQAAAAEVRCRVIDAAWPFASVQASLRAHLARRLS